MTRISENQSTRQLVANTLDNKQKLNQFANEITTGYKVTLPGDSNQAGTISQYRQTIEKIDSYGTAIVQTKSFLQFQDDAMAQVSDIIIRAKEIASQAANETNSDVARAQLAGEIFELRDNLASLANSTFQGKYVWGGAADDSAPYTTSTYTNPATGPASQRYVIDPQPGRTTLRTIQITDTLNLTVNSAAAGLFDTAIRATERLGRSLSGYSSTLTAGAPDGGGVALVFPTDYIAQTTEIKATIDQLDLAREQQVIPERVGLGAKLRRLETGESLLTLTKNSAQDVLGRLQNADETESASNLQQAQNALQASYTVTARVLRLTILDYI
jgi:flagellar hook-associated protein 3 FlgL